MKRPVFLTLVLLASATALFAPPAWWSEQGTDILVVEGEENNYAPANLGQLKHVAKRAKAHLDANVFGGAGSTIDALVAGFEPRADPSYTQQQIDDFIAENYAPINLGQLKRVAKPFYDRLIEVGYETKANLIARGYSGAWAHDYPWDPATPVADNYAPANLGQLKMVFSFDLDGFDSDGDGLPDDWETAQGYDPNDAYSQDPDDLVKDGAFDSDGDGLTNLQEHDQGGDPNDYYDQGGTTITPVLSLVGGNNQSWVVNQYLTEPLSVEVRSGTGGALLINAPVVYTVTSGGGGLAEQYGEAVTSGTVTVVSGTAGLAESYYRQGISVGVSSTISAQAGQGAAVEFESETIALSEKQVVAGEHHSLAIKANGSLWVWGRNDEGQLGLGITNNQWMPRKLEGLRGVKALAGGSEHSVVVDAGGKVWSFGANTSGQLGDGTTTQSLVPVAVSGTAMGSGVEALAAGDDHSVALKSDGSVWAWGNGAKGRLGNGGTSNSSVPVAVSGTNLSSGVEAVAAGSSYSLAIKSDGSLWVWGRNQYGQLGTGNNTEQLTAVEVSPLSNVIAVAGGENHTVALKSDGTVWSTGRNTYGQLGIGSTTSKNIFTEVSGLTGVVEIGAGVNHSVAVKSDGTVVAWGRNNNGQLGDGTTTTRTAPVAVGNISNGEGVSAGEHILVTLADGSVVGFGYNNYGAIGDGSDVDRNSAVAVEDFIYKAQVERPIFGIEGGAYLIGQTVTVSCATAGAIIYYTTDGSEPTESDAVIASGSSVAVNATEILRARAFKAGLEPSPTKSGAYEIGGQVEAGKNHSLTIWPDGSLWVWGHNHKGQLGLGNTTNQLEPQELTTLGLVKSVSGGIEHSLVVDAAGKVWGMGGNTFGQVGDGTTTTRTTPVAVSGTNLSSGVTAVSAGHYHSLALKSDGSVWAWGSGANGRLGNGTTTNSSVPLAVSGLGAGSGVIAVSAGSNFSVAVKADGTLWGWGQNAYRYGTGNNISYQTPVLVGTLNDVVAVSAGGGQTMAVKSDGTIWGAGLNNYGQLGVGDTASKSYFWKVSGLSVVATGAGESHSVAVKADGTVVSWGRNQYGQLGDGTTTNSNVPVAVGSLTNVSAIGAGNHTLAVKQGSYSERYWSWGYNLYGELGVNDTVSRSVPVLVSFIYPDGDDDGLLDVWETAQGYDPEDEYSQDPNDLVKDGAYDTDGDGLTNLQEFQQGSDPNDYFSQGSLTITPVVSLVGGNNQTGLPDEYLTEVLTVEVRSGSSTGPVLDGAPVIYTVTSGSGVLATQYSGTVTSGTLTVETDTNGMANAYYQQGTQVGVTSTITAQSGTTEAVSFTAWTTAASGLWSRWKFDEGTGTTASEEIGIAVSGTLTNGADWTTGFDGEDAVVFSGSNQHVTMGDPANQSLDFGGDSFSIALWVKYSEAPTSGNTIRIVSKGNDNWGSGYFVGVREDGKLATGMGTVSGTQSEALLFRTTGTFNDDEWHHVAVTYDRENTTGQIYVDGVAQTLEKEAGTGGTVNSQTISYATLSGLSASGTSEPFTVSSFSGTSDFFNGGVDDVRIYRKVLNGTEVVGLYDVDSQAGTSLAGLPDRWEWEHFGQLGVDPNGHADEDGLTNLEEYELGSDPNDRYDPRPNLEIVSGDNQSGIEGVVLPNPLVVKVTGSGSNALINMPVEFGISGSNGQIAMTGTGAFGLTQSVVTGTGGMAEVYLMPSGTSGAVNEVLAQVGTGTNSASVLFAATALVDTDGDGLPDTWEQAIVDADPFDEIESIADVLASGNLDGDSLSNLEEWEHGLNPLDGSDAPGRLEILSGDEQTSDQNQEAAQPLKIKVVDFLDETMVGETVRVRVEEGEGLIRVTGTGAFVSSVETTTDAQGEISVDYQAGEHAGGTTQVLYESDLSPSVEATQYTSGWLGIWSFDEGAGTAGADDSSYQRPATLLDTTWVSGTSSPSLNFLHFTSTLNSLVTVENSAPTLNLNGGAFTVMAWVNTTQTDAARLIGQGLYAGFPGFALDMGPEGAGRISATIGDPEGDSIRLTTTGTFNDGQWHHVAFVVNRATGLAGLFVDGVRSSVQEGVPPAGATLTSVPISSEIKSASDQALVFGWEPGTGDYFDGDLDAVRFHRGALSDGEIAGYVTPAVDSDGDGLPDDWEQQIIDADPNDAIDDLAKVKTGDDYDGDNISNENEFLAGTSPVDYYNGEEPVILIVDGDHQSGTSSVLLDKPLRIQVYDRKDRQLLNAPLSVIPADSQAEVGVSGTSLAPSLDFRTVGGDAIYIKP